PPSWRHGGSSPTSSPRYGTSAPSSCLPGCVRVGRKLTLHCPFCHGGWPAGGGHRDRGEAGSERRAA
ncbi:MAG: hypothetical protein ACK56I_23405, partial [bacterium]